jgi:hypothetical protein
MPIQEQNIVFVESQVMDDVPEGGGAATGIVIADGQMNNVFEDVSDLDRAYGRLNLRKLFLAVRTLSTDLFGGAKTAITMLPIDPAIGYTLFSANDPFDTREMAANRVESYLYKGPTWSGHLLENHITGMSMINVLQRIGTALPPIGKTLCLVVDEGLPTEQEQYVRVIDVTVVERSFSDEHSGTMGDFTRWQVTLSLSDALRYDFAGHEARRYDSAYSYTGKTRIRDTSVADAARYYGAMPVTVSANIGDLQVRAASIFTQLVPSAETETPLANRTLAGEAVPMVRTAAAPISYSAPGAAVGPGLRLVLRAGAYPGSINVAVGAVTVTDDGAGNAYSGPSKIGTVEYSTGEILFDAAAPSASGTATITYQPATAAPQQSQTRARQVTAESRRLNWIETLLPIPAPHSLEVSYRAQGAWYTLRDNGAGVIAGTDPAFGAGTVSYVTGSVEVTLGALPDVGSQIMFTWGTPAHYAVRTVADINLPAWTHQTAHQSIEPGTVTITWTADSVLRTVTDNGAGLLTGDGEGAINYALGLVYLRPTLLPEPNATPLITYDSGGLQSENFTPSVDGNGFINVTIAGAPVEPGSVVIEWETTRTKTSSEKVL